MTDSTQIDAPIVQTLPQLLAAELTTLLEPLTRIAADPAELDALLRTLGAMPSEAQRTAILTTITAAAGVIAQVEEVAAQPELSFEAAERLLALGEQAFAALRALDTAVQGSPELAGFGRDVIARLFGSYLAHAHPLLRSVAVLTTVIEDGMELAPSEPIVRDDLVVRQAFTLDRFHFERIARLLRDPLGLFRTEYGASIATSAEATALAQKLFPRLYSLLTRFGLNVRASEILADEGASAPAPSLTVHVDDMLLGAQADAGVTVVLSPVEHGNLGLLVVPFGTLDLERTIGAWQFRLALEAGTNAFAYGPQGLKVLDAASQTSVGATASATLPPADTGPRFVLGSATGTRLEIGGIAVSAAAKFTTERHALAFDATMSKSALVIAADDGDGFLAQVLPKGGLRAELDLGLGWSTDHGFALHGAASLEGDLPVSISIGGLTMSGIHLALRASDDRVGAEISSTFSLSIGPVYARIDRVGMQGALTFPASGGNLGPADLSLGFKPPSGVALSIDASGVVSGGGFLSHDPATGTYAGAMKLSLHDRLTLSAYGLIATRMPDGRPGYSLLVFITAEGFQPIPLGLGFVLTSIGGLIGVNRTFDYDVLQAGLKSDTLATLLFPRDPVGNAPALIQALAAAFPARSGSFLLGLLARITWFTPTLITLDLGLVLEVGSRTRLLVLGRVSALLPTAENDLVRLVLDTVGELDFDAGALSVDAMVVDSRLLHRFPITGAAAVRAHWGHQAGPTGQAFVLAAGGFNPRFATPVGFPTLERLAISLTKGKNPRLVCESYFAITSNTLQFGARASLYAEAIGFSLTGEIGYDVLVSWAPLHFVASFQGKVQLKRGSHNLFKLELKGTLEGPQPLRLSGKVTFEIFWISFTVRVDATLADGVAPAGLAAVNVADLLAAAVAAASNWRTQLTPGVAHGVALRSVTSHDGPVLDPLGQMVLEQQVVPLNLTRDVDTYGGAPVAGPRRFALTGKLNDTSATSVQGAFAPARFFALSDDEKLAAPSFEAMDAGLVLGDASIRYAAAAIEAAPLEYEPITLNPDGAASAPADDTKYQLPVASLAVHVRTGAAAQAPVRQVGRARFRNLDVEPAATVTAPQWTIVRTSDGTPAPAASNARTWSEQRVALNLLNRGGAAWTLVPTHELAVA